MIKNSVCDKFMGLIMLSFFKYLGIVLFLGGNASAVDRRDGSPFIDVFEPTPGIQLRFFEVGPIINTSQEAKEKPPVLFLTGMGGFLEEYPHVLDALRQQSRKVYGLEWRGQGGSTRIPDRVHVESFDHYVQDLQAFVDQKITESRFDIFALSMGAHVAFRYATLSGGERIHSIAAISPMVRMITPFPFWFSRVVANTACFFGLNEGYALGQGPYEIETASQHLRESHVDDAELARYRSIIGASLDKAPGGVTWGWVAAAMESVEALVSTEIPASAIIFQSPWDTVVDVGSYPELTRRVRRVERDEVYAPHDMFFGGEAILRQIIEGFERFSREQRSERE